MVLDSDDKLAQTFLERTVACLDAAPDAGFAVTGTRLFGSRRGKLMPPESDLVRLLCLNVVGPHWLTRYVLGAGGWLAGTQRR